MNSAVEVTVAAQTAAETAAEVEEETGATEVATGGAKGGLLRQEGKRREVRKRKHGDLGIAFFFRDCCALLTFFYTHIPLKTQSSRCQDCSRAKRQRARH